VEICFLHLTSLRMLEIIPTLLGLPTADPKWIDSRLCTPFCYEMNGSLKVPEAQRHLESGFIVSNFERPIAFRLRA
jgi:hypothetical protein